MQIIHECLMRATILTILAKDDTELENQLLYVAQEWLTLATLREQLTNSAVGMNHKSHAPAGLGALLRWRASLQDVADERSVL